MKHFDKGGNEVNLGADNSKLREAERQADNEIKMQMAKDITCSLLISQRGTIPTDYIEQSCDIAEQIFNRFNNR